MYIFGFATIVKIEVSYHGNEVVCTCGILNVIANLWQAYLCLFCVDNADNPEVFMLSCSSTELKLVPNQPPHERGMEQVNVPA